MDTRDNTHEWGEHMFFLADPGKASGCFTLTYPLWKISLQRCYAQRVRDGALYHKISDKIFFFISFGEKQAHHAEMLICSHI